MSDDTVTTIQKAVLGKLYELEQELKEDINFTIERTTLDNGKNNLCASFLYNVKGNVAELDVSFSCVVILPENPYA